MYKAIIFDMDGTLVDSEVVWDSAEREMFAEMGLEYTAEIREQVIGLRLDEFFERLIQIYGLTDTVDSLVDNLIDRMLKKIPEMVQPKPGAQAVIEWASRQDIPYCIASSSPMSIIEATVHTQRWNSLIPRLYTADDVEKGKPAPDVYLHAAQAMGVDAQHCLAIEDSPNGARSAVAAGMTCYVVPDSHSTPEKFNGITAHVYPTLHDVLDILQNGTSRR